MEDKDLIEYIKIHWADIHHSRNQDWKILILIAGIFYILFKIPDNNNSLYLLMVVLGLVACGMGAYISISHWFIFYRKMLVIKQCELKLGIELKKDFYNFPFPFDFFPVQGIIVFIYFFIAGILVGWLILKLKLGILFAVIILTAVLSFGFNVCVKMKKKIKNLSDEKYPFLIFTSGDKNE
ncbi:MAG: hypothetical protein ACE5GM_02230 [bacterium]